MKSVKGVSLVELLLVAAIAVSVLGWFLQSFWNTYKNYQSRLVMEQAYQDIRAIEMLRRSMSSAPGFLSANSLNLAALKAQYPNSDELTNLVSESSIYTEIQSQSTAFSLNRFASELQLQMVIDDSHVDFYPGANTVYESVTVSGAGADAITAHRQNVSLSYRETDPMILNYVVDVLYQR